MDVVISFGPGELHIRWTCHSNYFMKAPFKIDIIYKSEASAKHVLLDFSNDSHVWIQTFETQLDHSGGR